MPHIVSTSDVRLFYFLYLQIISHMTYQEFKERIEQKWYNLYKADSLELVEAKVMRKLNILRHIMIDGHLLTQKQMLEAILLLHDVLPEQLDNRTYAKRVNRALSEMVDCFGYLGPFGIASMLGINENRVVKAKNCKTKQRA